MALDEKFTVENALKYAQRMSSLCYKRARQEYEDREKYTHVNITAIEQVRAASASYIERRARGLPY